MADVSGKYAIVGLGETVVGKRPEASTNSLHLEAIRNCLADAGIKASQVDGLLTKRGIRPIKTKFPTTSLSSKRKRECEW